VLGRDRATGTVHFHPAYLAFCRDWGVQPGVRAVSRVDERQDRSGVKYVKRNALAGLTFESFSALEQHLTVWMTEADRRVHGTTHEAPLDRFVREEQAALRPLPARPLPREQRLRRRVSPGSRLWRLKRCDKRDEQDDIAALIVHSLRRRTPRTRTYLHL
jgi:hypothetical protein